MGCLLQGSAADQGQRVGRAGAATRLYLACSDRVL